MYWMYKVDENDEVIGGGDSGSMSQAIFPEDWDDIGTCKVHVEHDARPRVGVVMRVGTQFARTYSQQDYWTTTRIEKILSETETEVRFLTQSNSTYLWKIR